LATLSAGQVSCEEQTLGALLADGYRITQMTSAEINADKVHVLLLLEGKDSAFLCKAEAIADRDTITPAVNPERFSDILGLKTFDGVKWRTCGQIF
jgi:hypothetical protein